MTDTFDFVVVGAGSGGCAVAGRLSEDAGTSVALLDAGGKNDNWMVTTPFALILMVAGKVNNWAFETVPQKGLNGRIGYQPRGKGLGGSSAINAMVYIRGHRWDYDHWASLGNTGWSYADVLPYFKRSENNADFDGEYHGKSGPLRVNKLRTGNPVHEIFRQAAQEAQFRVREDFNAEDHEGLGTYQVTQENGERWSAARAYVHPHIGSRSNLQVETSAQATKILFEGKRAVGVEYMQGKQKKTIRARREVILASGAFQSPQLLLLSGVGDSAAARTARHRVRASFARRRREFAGPSGFHLQLRLRRSLFLRHLAEGHSAADPRHRPVSTGAARADHHEFRRMRRLPEDAARSRSARHPAAFRHVDRRQSRPHAPSRHRLLLPCLPAAAEEPRHARPEQRRSARRAPDRSELPRRGGRSRGDGRGLQDHAAADGDACAARACRQRTCSPRT